jgi:gliding motility-associated-like protein
MANLKFFCWLSIIQLLCSNAFAQNSLVGDGFGGRLWYVPSNYCVGSYSAYSVCYTDTCGNSLANQLYAWGSNSTRQLGIDSTGALLGSNTPTKVIGMSNVKFYTCGYYMAAIKHDNSGWMWGTSANDTTRIAKPLKVVDDVKHADAGIYGVHFVHNNGEVSSISSNQYGECGNGKRNQLSSPINLTPIKMLNIKNAVRIACTFTANIILLKDGSLMSVGVNESGILGIGRSEDNLVHTIPVPVQNISKVVDIKSNTYSIIALDSLGDVYTWGNTNDLRFSQLQNRKLNRPTKIPQLKDIVAISGTNDGYHFLALDSEQNVYAWGNNLAGQLGNSNINWHLSPIKVASGVIDIMAGELFSYIVKADGSLWCSGSSHESTNRFSCSIWLNLKDTMRTSFTKLSPEKFLGCPAVFPMLSKVQVEDSFCRSNIIVNMLGGRPPYLFNIGNGNQSSNVFRNISNGKYTITITDAKGCMITENVDVNNKLNVSPTFDTIPPICEAISVSPLPQKSKNGISGKWYPPYDSSQSKKYVFIPDSALCFDSVQLKVDIIPLVTPEFDSIPELCENHAINPLLANSKNGITGKWNEVFDPTVSKTYTFIPDSGQCAKNQTIAIKINQNQYPKFDPIAPVCEGDIISLSNLSLNGISGTWFPPFKSDSTREYFFTPDPNQCAKTTSIIIQVIQKVIPKFDSIAPVCEGDMITMSKRSLDGIKGSWFPPFQSDSTREYFFTPDNGQCAKTISLKIQVIPKVIPTFDPIISICEGEKISLPNISLNGIKGSWAPQVLNDSTVEYIFTEEQGQCASSAVMKIKINKKNKPEFLPIPDICEGDILLPLSNISLNGIKGSWFPALDNMKTQSYFFTPDNNQCATPSSIIIRVNAKTDPIFNSINPICFGSQKNPLQNTSLNGISGEWIPTFDNQKTTDYTFIPDSQYCAKNYSLSIAILPKQGVEFKHIEPICKGDYLEDLPTTSIHGVKGYWTPQLNNQQSTMYTFHVIGDQCVTDSTKNLLIIVNDLPIADAGKDTSIYEGQSINLHGKGGLTYHWYPDTDLSCDHCERPTCSALQTIQYQLEVTDENGCTDIDSVWIFVNQNIDVFVPNVFSPNNDQYNDIFTIYSEDKSYFIRTMSIYDRWGEQLFYGTNLKAGQGWNGTFRENQALPGVYVYIINAENERGIRRQLIGDCTILR